MAHFLFVKMLYRCLNKLHFYLVLFIKKNRNALKLK